MIVCQVISVFKHDLFFQIQLEATFKSFKNAQNFIQHKCRDCEKIDGPRYNFGDFGEYIASCRVDGIPSGVEEFYIKTCPIFDGKMQDEIANLPKVTGNTDEVLDEIRAEIEALPKTYPFINHIDTYVKEDDVKKIIDKYKAEKEE